MTPYAAAQITKDRLRLWQKRNERANYCATPALLVSINHEEGKSGQLILNTVEDLSDTDIVLLLEAAAKLMKENIERKNANAGGKN